MPADGGSAFPIAAFAFMTQSNGLLMPFSQQYPLGAQIPNSVHAVCVSLPTLSDVVAYEEGHPEARRVITAGYPRFVTHFYIQQLADHVSGVYGLEGRRVCLVPTMEPQWASKWGLWAFIGENSGLQYLKADGFGVLHVPEQDVATFNRLRAFLQHTGLVLSSRQAEDLLLKAGLIEVRQLEPLFRGAAEAMIEGKLKELFGLREVEDVVLCSSGMNAFYAAFKAINAVQTPRGRNLWVLLGWVYMDTYHVLKSMNSDGRELRVLRDVFDVQALEAVLKAHGEQVAGILCEVPTNPLLQTCDLPQIKELAEGCGAALLVDPTLSSPYNIDVLPYADLVVNSLTKYAASQGDVMAGSVVLNTRSSFYESFKSCIVTTRQPLYYRDAQRLAFEIQDYEIRVAAMNANAMAMAAFLESCRSVKKVYWAYEACSRRHYEQLAQGPARPGACLTIELNKPLAEFYDRARVVKGPSFGTVFTLMCPYMYLAHYSLVRNPKGRRTLREWRINPDLVRISVGTEPTGALLGVFKEVLDDS